MCVKLSLDGYKIKSRDEHKIKCILGSSSYEKNKGGECNVFSGC